MLEIKEYEFYYKLRTLKFVDEIWLYGSHASGRSGEPSDIDLAIICPHATTEEWAGIWKVLEISDTLLEIDCVRFDATQDERFKKEVESSKMVLFNRVPNNFP